MVDGNRDAGKFIRLAVTYLHDAQLASTWDRRAANVVKAMSKLHGASVYLDVSDRERLAAAAECCSLALDAKLWWKVEEWLDRAAVCVSKVTCEVSS